MQLKVVDITLTVFTVYVVLAVFSVSAQETCANKPVCENGVCHCNGTAVNLECDFVRGENCSRCCEGYYEDFGECVLCGKCSTESVLKRECMLDGSDKECATVHDPIEPSKCIPPKASGKHGLGLAWKIVISLVVVALLALAGGCYCCCKKKGTPAQGIRQHGGNNYNNVPANVGPANGEIFHDYLDNRHGERNEHLLTHVMAHNPTEVGPTQDPNAPGYPGDDDDDAGDGNRPIL